MYAGFSFDPHLVAKSINHPSDIGCRVLGASNVGGQRYLKNGRKSDYAERL
jgi:hypothetical protein